MINCVAIDDEPIALSILEEYCGRIGDVVLRSFSSPVAGMEYIQQNRPDIVFLDIEMNSHNGVALARTLPAGTCLVFTTAYAQYAIDGFEVDAIDFLQKPIFFPRFERALDKARRLIESKKELAERRDTITLKSEHKNVIVVLDDVMFIEAMDNYVKVFRRGLPMVMSQITMKEMEDLLPRDRFMRVHRSYIIALDAIDRFSNRQIYLSGHKTSIPVGRKYSETFNSVYNNK